MINTQGGTLPVINGVIPPLNGFIGHLGYNPIYRIFIGVITPFITARGPPCRKLHFGMPPQPGYQSPPGCQSPFFSHCDCQGWASQYSLEIAHFLLMVSDCCSITLKVEEDGLVDCYFKMAGGSTTARLCC